MGGGIHGESVPYSAHSLLCLFLKPEKLKVCCSGARYPGFESWLHFLPAMRYCSSYLTPVSFNCISLFKKWRILHRVSVRIKWVNISKILRTMPGTLSIYYDFLIYYYF